MADTTCGQRFTCDACKGSGCDHCGDVGTIACPCATGHYVHGLAEQGETCTECGDRFPTGADILRPAPISTVGCREPYAERTYPLPVNVWHVACR